MEKFIAFFVAVVGLIAIVVGLSFLSAWFVMLMVNYLFTSAVLLTVFGVAKIGFWRAFVLTVLTGTLFKVSILSPRRTREN